MRKSLLTKFIFGYIIFAVAGFILIATLSYNLLYKQSLSYEANDMRAQAGIISSRSMDAGTDPDMLSLMTALSQRTVWITDQNGKIIYDSDGKQTGRIAEAFNPLENSRYILSDMGGMLSARSLIVFTSAASNFRTSGYVIMAEPVSIPAGMANESLIPVYVTFGIIFILSFVLLFILYFAVIKPLKKITAAADEYAAGNLNYPINVDSADEVGHLSRTLSYMAQELSESENNQKRFISNISHDFRSPLTSIKGYLEAIRDGVIPPEKQPHYLELVINETDRLAALTQNVLSLSNLSQGGSTPDFSVFDINPVIKSTCESFEGQCRKKDMDFDLYFSTAETYVRADCEKIKQVLYNLIDNAIKFSPDGSTITISTDEKGGKIFVSVKDQGCGIPKESIKKIWTRFYKTDESRGKDKKGTGLGLAIVKDIITGHGEKIDVISTPGSGSEFIFTLKRGK